MVSLTAVELGDPRMPAVASVLAGDLNCSRFSPERHTPECEERAQIGVGVFVVVAVLLLAVGFLLWRRMMKKVDDKDPGGSGDSP